MGIRRIIIFVLLFVVLQVGAQENADNSLIELSSIGPSLSLAGHYYFFEDETGRLTLDDVSSPAFAEQFQLARTPNLNFGFTDSAIWLMFQASNSVPHISDWLLEFAYPLLDRIEVHTLTPDGQQQMLILGDTLPFRARPLPHRTLLAPLSFKGEQVNRYFIRISTESSMQIRPTIYSGIHFFQQSNLSEFIYGAFYGVLLLMVLYNAFLYFAMRDTTYLVYVFAVFSATLFFMVLHGHAHQYLWPDEPAWANTLSPLSSSLWLIGTAIFTKLFLETRRYVPRLSRMLDGLIVIGGIAILLALTARYSVAMQFTSAAALINGLAILVTGLICWLRGNKYARLFTIAWVVYGTGMALLALSRLGYIPDNFFTLNAAAFGLAFEIILLSMALSDKYRILTEQLEVHARELEQRVAARTAELELANKTLRQLSNRDQLTHLANRRRFDDYLAQEWQRHVRNRQPLALLLLDVDFFKAYNDHYGHQAGDGCLHVIAATISRILQRPTDLAARYGGEEFALILPETSLGGAVSVAEKVRAEIQALDIVHAASSAFKRVTISVGVAAWVPSAEQLPALLIKSADEALYKAKRSGRNRVVPPPR